MTIRFVLLVVVAAMVFEVPASAHETSAGEATLTGNFWGLGDELAKDGLSVSLSATSIYQQNVSGGLSTHKRAGRFSGSYDLELEADLAAILGIEGGSIYMLGEGSWSKSGGINDGSVGSWLGVNGDAALRRALDITQLWYEQAMADDTFRLRFGKIDLTGGFECKGCPVSFDGSMYANDETSQFLNPAFVNNPTIPFPDNGLGIIAYWNPVEWWYLAAGAADAQSDVRETGFRTALHKEDYFVYMAETGVVTEMEGCNGKLPGGYRIGMWYDPQPKVVSSEEDVKTRRDDAGFYVTCDQMILKETNDENCDQGMGLFGRYGYAPSNANDLTQFWSFGAQYKGLLEGRDQDVMGFAFGQGFFSDKAAGRFTSDCESATELYYNIQLTPWANLTPSVQYITNPSGDSSAKDATVFAIRAQIVF